MRLTDARIIDIYDGDTFTVEVPLWCLAPSSTVQVRVRLLGVDTPEIRGKERDVGLVVRDDCRRMLLGANVVLSGSIDSEDMVKSGKYGRPLVYVLAPADRLPADATSGSTNADGSWWVHQWLIETERAVAYGGGKR